MISHDQTSSPVALTGNAAFAGGSCDTCTYWLGSHGCCRSDCARFRSMIPVDRCLSWKPVPPAASLQHVTFGRVVWSEPVRRIA